MPWKVVAGHASWSDDLGFDKPPAVLNARSSITTPPCQCAQFTVEPGPIEAQNWPYAHSATLLPVAPPPPPLHATPHRPVSITAP